MDDPRLSSKAYGIIEDGANLLLLSAATGWEVAVKFQLGKLSLSEAPVQYVPDRMAHAAMESLPILMSHALHVQTLPLLHRDPFDRLLVAQAQVEGLPILTNDPQIGQYAVDVIW
jgi:PIN domain nuclease of toxin-antitoxin system